MRRTAYAATALTAAAVLTASPAGADVALISSGSTGTVELLTFGGQKETWPTLTSDAGDASQASVECAPLPRGRRAVFAGALAWAADDQPGMHNDWRYVRVTAGAADDEGVVVSGETSPYYIAYDDRPAAIPAVSVILPDGDATYTPLLTVQVFDATYNLVGASVVGAQVGAWPADDGGWLTGPSDLVRCP